MKNVLILLACQFIALTGFGQADQQTAKPFVTDTTRSSIAFVSNEVLKIKRELDTLVSHRAELLETKPCTFCQPKLDGGQLFLVAMPILLFLIASVYFLVRLQREGYKISDSFKENYTVDISKTGESVSTQRSIQIERAFDGDKEAPPVPIDQLPKIRPQSSSRLSAFFASVAAIIITISTLTFSFYVYLRTGQEPDLKNLWDMVLALGIGVIPYAFNRLSDAMSPTKV